MTHPSELPVTPAPFTRRHFMKKSALTAGALAVLSQGTALATGEAESATYKWGLMCSMDPGGSADPTGKAAFGHDGASGTRTWWKRTKTTWGGGDDAVCLEARGTGPVADPQVIKKSFSVTGVIKGTVSNDDNDGDSSWAGRFYTSDGSDDNMDDDEMAYATADLPEGRLSINEQSGEVFFEPNPPVLTPMEDGCKSVLTSWQGFWDDNTDPYSSFTGNWSNFKLVGAGVIGPQIQLSAAAGLVEVGDTSYEFSLGGTLGGGDDTPGSVTAGYKVTTKSLPQTTSSTLPWSFHRMRKQLTPTEGDWVDMGPANAGNMQPTPSIPSR